MLSILELENRLNNITDILIELKDDVDILKEHLNISNYNKFENIVNSLKSEIDNYKGSIDNKVDKKTLTDSLINELYNNKDSQIKLKQSFTSVMDNKILIYPPSKINIDSSVLSAKIDWNKIESATDYIVFYTDIEKQYTSQLPKTSNTFAILPRLEPNTEYEVYIRALADKEISEIGTKVKFKTKEIN